MYHGMTHSPRSSRSTPLEGIMGPHQLERDVRRGDLFNATRSRLGIDAARRGIREDLITYEARSRTGGEVLGQTELT